MSSSLKFSTNKDGQDDLEFRVVFIFENSQVPFFAGLHFQISQKIFFYVRSIILYDFHELIPYLRILKFFCFHYPHSKPPYFWVDPQNNIISIPFVYLASLLIRINTAVSDFKKFVKFTTWFWKGGSDWDHEYISF